MDRFNFVSETSELMVRFHSDYSISGKGFSLTWQAVDVSACPIQTLTAKEGAIVTPNYPRFLLAHLDCTINILAPTGKRIWLEFAKNDGAYEVVTSDKDYLIELMLGKRSRMIRPFSTEALLTEGSFVSVDERVKLHLQTGDQPVGRGFSATYKILSVVEEEKVITLTNFTSGTLLHLNFPDRPPSNVNFIQRFVAPLGYIISLELHNVHFTETECPGKNGIIEVFDNYSDVNGTTWKLCHDPGGDDVPSIPIYISSFLNTLHVRQRHGLLGVPLNGTMKVQLDGNHLQKLISFKESEVEACSPNPCQNGGKCISKKSRKFCQCTGHFTGLFCALTKCDLEPCAFGTCSLTPTSYECHCRTGYTGPTCDQKRKPCESNPCDGRGVCAERGDGFVCRCHAWWEGPRCERRMTKIPYTPLSERMLHEPFWLGLMTVFVVMGVIGLVWCAKRHFPEKIEKLLAEEDSRNRSTISSLRSSSVRDQLVHASSANPLSTNSASNPTPSLSAGGAAAAGGAGSGSAPNSSAHSAPRSIFGRLGIRKPSILSLTSPHACDRHATPRTFSLDDLLKPPPRRTPSPKKKRNNSTPTKKNAAEKKQILQHLVSPINKQNRKVSLGELIQLSEIKSNEPTKISQENGKEIESKFGGVNPATAALNDPKLEKKVTFARLLNKVSAEMSSGSDFELGLMQTNRLGCAIARPSSTPPSPSVDLRSPHSTSSNQGSTSLTSSDLAIPSALSSSISDLLIHRRHNSHHHRLPNGRQKPASADSILAMFRNFSSSTAGVNLPSSLRISPSTTPTASSPQDDLVGDDDSSTSSIHTPISLCSLPPESPVSSRHGSQSIEIPVLDPLSAHKSNQASGSNLLHPPTILLEIPSTINKCLSPIHEMPTPLPSPALTPIMRRSPVMTTPPGDDTDLSDDRISVEIPDVTVVCRDGEEEAGHRAEIAIDLQAEDGLIMEEAAAMQMSASKTKPVRPSPVGHAAPPPGHSLFAPMITIEPPPLVIPTLTVQTPSPTIPQLPTITFGSPPPVRRVDDTCFPFPSPKQSRKLLKDFDKPTSLDLPSAPPMITITCNMSEAESDGDSISPAVNVVTTTVGMTYLSPFSMSTRGEHNASESNLSSSGYSSMASPGPSRCGSSNPLCPSEMEDQGPHGSGHGGGHRRQSTPILKTNTSTMACSSNEKPQQQDQRRGRSDSETLSDDPLLESNDEGIGTDHIDEKIDDGEVKSAKELEVFMNETETCKLLLDLPLPPMLAAPKCSLEEAVDRLLPPPTANKNSLQLPSIVVQCDSPGCEKHLSPMSSRSESPLSDKTSGMGRFSPQFYGRNKDLLPFTDSDGLYDFPSSDKVNLTTCTHPKKQSRKREKKQLRSIKTSSPTKHQLIHHSLSSHLDIPCKDGGHKVPPPRKLSPKRRIVRSQVVSSSSSSDSISSTRENRLSSSSPSPDTIRWSSPVAWSAEKCSRSLEASAEETNDVQESPSLPNTLDFSKIHYSHQKVSRLRAISHQIRFLRRLEQSLKRKERVGSPDSLDSGEESPRATSPLLQKPRPLPEIRKSSSSGLLQMGGVSIGGRRNGNRRGGEKTGQHEPLLAQPVMLTGNGYSD
nr:unnamed protein product [Callosobruchus analis]